MLRKEVQEIGKDLRCGQRMGCSGFMIWSGSEPKSGVYWSWGYDTEAQVLGGSSTQTSQHLQDQQIRGRGGEAKGSSVGELVGLVRGL